MARIFGSSTRFYTTTRKLDSSLCIQSSNTRPSERYHRMCLVTIVSHAERPQRFGRISFSYRYSIVWIETISHDMIVIVAAFDRGSIEILRHAEQWNGTLNRTNQSIESLTCTGQMTNQTKNSREMREGDRGQRIVGIQWNQHLLHVELPDGTCRLQQRIAFSLQPSLVRSSPNKDQ